MQLASIINATAADFDSVVLQNENAVVVDFWAEWCGPCRMMNPVLEELAEARKGNTTVVKVNVDEQPELASRFGIRSIPTLLVFKNGELKQQVTGVTSASALSKMLDALS